MEIYKAFAVVIASVCFIQNVQGGCKVEIQQSSEYSICLSGYATFMSSASTQDSAQMMAHMCGDEGRGYLACISEYMTTCPELFDSPSMGSMSTTINQMGDLDAMCAMMSGGGDGGMGGGDGGMGGGDGGMGVGDGGMGGGDGGMGSGDGGMGGGDCVAAHNCTAAYESAMQNAQRFKPSNDVMRFAGFQNRFGMLCGPFKVMLRCFEKESDKCPQISEMIDQYQSSKGTKMDFKSLQGFIQTNCETIPDSETNTCVRNKFTAAENNGCEKESEEFEEQECEAYGDVLNCMDLEECGDDYSAVFRKFAELELSQKKSLSCDFTSGSPLISASIFTILAATIIAIVNLF